MSKLHFSYEADIEAQALVLRQQDLARLDVKRDVTREDQSHAYVRAKATATLLPDRSVLTGILFAPDRKADVAKRLLEIGCTFETLRACDYTLRGLVLDKSLLTFDDVVSLGVSYARLVQNDAKGLLASFENEERRRALSLIARRCIGSSVELMRRDGLLGEDAAELVQLGPRALKHWALTVGVLIDTHRVRAVDVVAAARWYKLSDWTGLGLQKRHLETWKLDVAQLKTLGWARAELEAIK
jgi:hypothetical protein